MPSFPYRVLWVGLTLLCTLLSCVCLQFVWFIQRQAACCASALVPAPDIPKSEYFAVVHTHTHTAICFCYFLPTLWDLVHSGQLGFEQKRHGNESRAKKKRHGALWHSGCSRWSGVPLPTLCPFHSYLSQDWRRGTFQTGNPLSSQCYFSPSPHWVLKYISLSLYLPSHAACL